MSSEPEGYIKRSGGGTKEPSEPDGNILVGFIIGLALSTVFWVVFAAGLWMILR